ncbi:hypothetical protein M8J76_006153 [Diaphorina citri]|nr:hypothetical protein M8J76_006153 [Diaphorina citri]
MEFMKHWYSHNFFDRFKFDSKRIFDQLPKYQLCSKMSKQKLIPPPPSIDLLIHSLKHHAPENPDPNTYAVCKNPFEEINATEELAKGQKILDYDSEPDSESEDALYETQWGDADQEFSDLQTIDHEMEYSEIVDRAGVYTGEEILKTSIEKATKLHALYCSQLNQLRQIYIDRKRQYLQELKKEKELYCSIHSQKKTSLEEMKKYRQLKALIAYGRKHRLDTILAKREHEKRTASTSKTPNKGKTYKCHHQEDGVRCFSTCVPLTKFCIRHILRDKRQVLFRACGAPFNNTTCNNPVLVTVQDEHCVFHSTFQSVLEREKQQAAEEAMKQETPEVKSAEMDEGKSEEVDIMNEESEVKKEENIDEVKRKEIHLDEFKKENVEDKREVKEEVEVKDERVRNENETQIDKVEEEEEELKEGKVEKETVEEEIVEETVEESVEIDVEDHIVHID